MSMCHARYAHFTSGHLTSVAIVAILKLNLEFYNWFLFKPIYKHNV